MESRKVVEAKERKTLFQSPFLKDDEAQNIEFEKTDSREVKRRSELGDSISVAIKRKQKLNQKQIAKEELTEPWYFTHI